MDGSTIIPTGCDWHPSVDEHRDRMAPRLVEALRRHLAW